MENKPTELSDQKKQIILVVVFSILFLIVIPIVANVINMKKKQLAGNDAVSEVENSKWPFSVNEGKLEMWGNPVDFFRILGLKQ